MNQQQANALSKHLLTYLISGLIESDIDHLLPDLKKADRERVWNALCEVVYKAKGKSPIKKQPRTVYLLERTYDDIEWFTVGVCSNFSDLDVCVKEDLDNEYPLREWEKVGIWAGEHWVMKISYARDKQPMIFRASLVKMGRTLLGQEEEAAFKGNIK